MLPRMNVGSQLIATVETTPARRFQVESRDDAEWLSQVSGCRVRVIEETVIEPKAPAAAPTPAPAPPAPAAPPVNGAALDGSSALSAPDKIRQRMVAQPDRTFRATDFPEIGDSAKVGNTLHRLAEAGDIERVERGEYRMLRSTTATPITSGSGTSTQVVAYLQQHPGEWLRAPQVTTGMGLGDERKPAVAAALIRLAKAGHISKRGSTFCFLTRGTRPEVRP